MYVRDYRVAKDHCVLCLRDHRFAKDHCVLCVRDHLSLRIIVSYVCEGYLTAVSTGVCGMHCYCYCCEFTVCYCCGFFLLSQRISCHVLPPFIAESADIC